MAVSAAWTHRFASGHHSGVRWLPGTSQEQVPGQSPLGGWPFSVGSVRRGVHRVSPSIAALAV